MQGHETYDDGRVDAGYVQVTTVRGRSVCLLCKGAHPPPLPSGPWFSGGIGKGNGCIWKQIIGSTVRCRAAPVLHPAGRRCEVAACGPFKKPERARCRDRIAGFGVFQGQSCRAAEPFAVALRNDARDFDRSDDRATRQVSRVGALHAVLFQPPIEITKLFFFQATCGVEGDPPRSHASGPDGPEAAVFDRFVARNDGPGRGLANGEGKAGQVAHERMVGCGNVSSTMVHVTRRGLWCA